MKRKNEIALTLKTKEGKTTRTEYNQKKIRKTKKENKANFKKMIKERNTGRECYGPETKEHTTGMKNIEKDNKEK